MMYGYFDFHRLAKAEKKRIWKNYTPSVLNIDVKDRNFTAKVVEVVNGDALNVKLADNTVKKIFLSSVRPPRYVYHPLGTSH